MLDITIRVTESSVHLKQIHQISVHNIARIGPGGDQCEYRVFLDGKDIGTVRHYRTDGAVRLTRDVMNHILKHAP